MKKTFFCFLGLALIFSFFIVGCDEGEVISFLEYQDKPLCEKSKRCSCCQISVVTLQGKINHFGMDITQSPPSYIDYHQTVPGVKVWIAEYPFTKDLNIITDETGWWTIHVVKYKGVDLEFSFIYEKEGWITTKSNVITVADEDILDLGIQYIDPLYYNLAVKPMVEAQLEALFGQPIPLLNAMVVTVGKSWSSIHSDMLPHGDPGAIATLTPPGAIGPLYFNEQVQPDPTWTETSVDGGVTWINVPFGSYIATAQKDGVEYKEAKFEVLESDAANGVVLYIATPPHSVEGTNDSPPGDF